MPAGASFPSGISPDPPATDSTPGLDADHTQTPDAILHIRLHRGFAKATRDLYPMIIPHLRAGYRTRVTGHSTRGAVAAITGL